MSKRPRGFEASELGKGETSEPKPTIEQPFKAFGEIPARFEEFMEANFPKINVAAWVPKEIPPPDSGERYRDLRPLPVGTYTLNPELKLMDFERSPVANIDLQGARGFTEAVKHYEKSFYLPGVEYTDRFIGAAMQNSDLWKKDDVYLLPGSIIKLPSDMTQDGLHVLGAWWDKQEQQWRWELRSIEKIERRQHRFVILEKPGL